ncbi:hypothetical protein F7725_008723 [Dissostichus mawsoni]|uniref:Tudor domain-containing protein n=1 Tax=Dissostichus mawsoni TaxID=36200 RepID=A0A7J5Y864_DISMA|nr:hypothetical protein F7725_008723 [Dissostichus mawsoni]
MDNERKHIYEQMREEIQNPDRKFAGSEGKLGDLCLVCIDGTWHRAWIVSIQRRSVNVMVSCFESLQKFWCQTTEDGDSLGRLMNDLQKHYASAHPQPLVESICVARSPDNGMWYRAKIMASQHSPVVDVRFIDFGKTGTVPLRDIRPIDPAFLQLNAKAFQCCLYQPPDKKSTNPTWTDREFVKVAESCASSGIGLTCTGNVNISMSTWPNISESKTVEVYASCIDGPHYFWCEYADEEQQKKVTRLAQEAGLAQQDMTFPEILGPGSPCLAWFSSDEHWYRAQVLRRVEDKFDVLFIDYGNETDVDIKNVRSVPQSLMEIDPQAFLCSLDGFDKSKGSWDDQVHDVFYNLLVDKLIRNMPNLKWIKPDFPPRHSDEVQQRHSDEVQQRQSDGVNKDNQMQSNKDNQMQSNKDNQTEDIQTESNKDNQTESNRDIQTEDIQTESNKDIQTESSKDIQTESNKDNQTESNKDNQTETNKDIQTDSNITHLNVSTGNVNAGMFKEPSISKNKPEEVYASCIDGPHYFWCEYADEEQQKKVTRLAQEAGLAQQDMTFPETLGPEHWYRAQVLRRVEDKFDVLFIDYGNETDVDIKNVRSVPQSLMEIDPQAFLCSLDGFDSPKAPGMTKFMMSSTTFWLIN